MVLSEPLSSSWFGHGANVLPHGPKLTSKPTCHAMITQSLDATKSPTGLNDVAAERLVLLWSRTVVSVTKVRCETACGFHVRPFRCLLYRQ
jgi:hypothetical protein